MDREPSRRAARSIDPTPYLEGRGFVVRREGRHRSVRDAAGDEVYRLTEPGGGKPWLWADAYGAEGGDNIDLVRTIEPGTGFAEAVWRLAGEPTATPQPPRPAPKREPPRLPKQTAADRKDGRSYLWGRGISAETMDAAERAGMLRYARRAVLFVGRDEAGRAQNVTRRAIEADAEVQKRDLRGSAKEYAAILPGNPDTVWIAEGGTDALALQDMARLRGEAMPTVIVSGGAQVRSWIERASAILKRARRIVLAGENEQHADAQERADAGHAKQAEQIEALAGQPVERWTPAKDKDVAALHARQVRAVEAAQRADDERRPETERAAEVTDPAGEPAGDDWTPGA